MYQLFRNCAGFMIRFFMKTRGWGTLNIAVRLILSEYRVAKYQATTPPQSCPTRNAFEPATLSKSPTTS